MMALGLAGSKGAPLLKGYFGAYCNRFAHRLDILRKLF